MKKKQINFYFIHQIIILPTLESNILKFIYYKKHVNLLKEIESVFLNIYIPN